MRKERKHYTAEEKVAILRRHLLDKVPVSDLCEELASSEGANIRLTTLLESAFLSPFSAHGPFCSKDSAFPFTGGIAEANDV